MRSPADAIGGIGMRTRATEIRQEIRQAPTGGIAFTTASICLSEGLSVARRQGRRERRSRAGVPRGDSARLVPMRRIRRPRSENSAGMGPIWLDFGRRGGMRAAIGTFHALSDPPGGPGAAIGTFPALSDRPCHANQPIVPQSARSSLRLRSSHPPTWSYLQNEC